MNVYSADFETLTGDISETRVWAYGIEDLYSDTYAYGTNIDDFMEYVRSLKKSSKIYFHNLRFDGSFVLCWLLAHDYTHLDKASEPQTFSTLITDRGQWYSIEVIFTYKTKKGRTKKFRVKFLDSAKIIPLRIEEMPDAFGIKGIEKGEIDYTLYRAIDHQLTEEEKSYLYRDVHILKLSLLKMFENGVNTLTLASAAMKDLKDTIGNGRYESLFPKIYADESYITAYNLTPSEKLILSADKFLRHGYKGAWTYVNPKFQNKELENVYVFDVNSLYPSEMKDNFYPYGTPIITDDFVDIPTHPLYVVEFECEFWIKEGMLPTVQIKRSMLFNPEEYLLHSKSEIVTLTMTSVDFEIFQEHYNVEFFKVHKVYNFRQTKTIFSDFIGKWAKVKEEAGRAGNKGLRFVSKQLQNSSYGKFASGIIKYKKIPYLEDGVLRFELSDYDFNPEFYLPVGMYVTAYGRRKILKYAQANIDSFVYCDTDSLHLTNPNPDLPIDDEKLGYFKLEKKFDRAYYIRAKRYVGEMDGKLKVTCAGLPESCHSQVTFDNFRTGAVYTGKLAFRQVSGGAILKETTFKLK